MNTTNEVKETEKPRRERGTGRIWQIGRIWWIQYYSHGRQMRESSHSAKETVAKRLLRKRLGQAAAGLIPSERTQRLTYEDLRDAYMKDYLTNGRKSVWYDKEGTARLDNVTRLDSFFVGRHVSEITTDLMQEFSEKLLAAGKGNSTVNRSLSALRRMFNLAKRCGKLREVPYFPMLKEPSPRQGLLTHEMYPTLLRELPDYLRLPLVLGYRTGMRLGEVRGLKWDQVNLADRVIHLNAGETKNDEARDIPIADELVTALREQSLKRRLECPYVCFRIEEGKALPLGDFRKAWHHCCVKLGLGQTKLVGKGEKQRAKYFGLTFHDLRRTFVTDAEKAGAARHEVMKITGHKTESVYKRYAIASPEGGCAALEDIEAYRASLKNRANSGQNQSEQTQTAGYVN